MQRLTLSLLGIALGGTLGIQRGEGLHATPVFGSTLLHLAIEYDDLDVAWWLMERGADVNAKAALDAKEARRNLTLKTLGPAGIG